MSGADDQVTLWDLALEADPEADAAQAGREDLRDIPPQLYFVHQGQRTSRSCIGTRSCLGCSRAPPPTPTTSSSRLTTATAPRSER